MHVLSAALLGLALFLSAPTASAQVRFLPYVGYNTSAGVDIEESFDSGNAETTGGFLVGVGVEFGLTPGFLPLQLKVRPSVETVFLSGEEVEESGVTLDASQNLLQANLDAIAEFAPPLSPIAPYAGVGLAYAAYSFETEAEFDGDTETEEVDDSAFGVNLLGGVRFGGGFVAPFVQARYSLLTIRPGESDLGEGEDFDEDEDIDGGLSIMAGVSIGL